MSERMPAARVRTAAARAQAGRKGGATTKARHGADFYQNIGRRGGAKLRDDRAGTLYYEAIGMRGGGQTRTAWNIARPILKLTPRACAAAYAAVTAVAKDPKYAAAAEALDALAQALYASVDK